MSIPRGNFLEYRKDPCGYTYQLFKDKGPISYIKLGFKKKVYFFNTQEAVEKVLISHGNHFHRGIALENAKHLIGESILTSDGQQHMHIRKILSKIYSKSYVAMFEAEIQKYIKKRLLEVNDGIIDLEDFFSSISLDIISILLFGKTSRDQVQLVNQTIASAFKLIARMYIPGYRLLMKTPLPLSKEFDQNMQQLNLLLKQLINNRDHSNNKYSGTIDLLVETGLKQEEILSQVLALFLAGHETTSTTLTWLVYGVLKNEYLSTQFLQECSTAVQKNTSYELMDQFPQLKAIIYETFRFYPPIWSIGRKVIKPIMIDQIQLVPGDFVGLSTYVMHRHPNSFELADQYIPARWITENGFYRPKPHEFFPFSHGSRNCIGKILAETEIFNMIKFLFNQFDLKLITKEKVEAKAFIALKPDQKILVEFKRR